MYGVSCEDWSKHSNRISSENWSRHTDGVSSGDWSKHKDGVSCRDWSQCRDGVSCGDWSKHTDRNWRQPRDVMWINIKYYFNNSPIGGYYDSCKILCLSNSADLLGHIFKNTPSPSHNKERFHYYSLYGPDSQ